MAIMEKLSDDALDGISGGAFNYYTNKAGQKKCVVDGVGTFYCSENAFENVAAYAADLSLNEFQITEWALANGYFSYDPIG